MAVADRLGIFSCQGWGAHSASASHYGITTIFASPVAVRWSLPWGISLRALAAWAGRWCGAPGGNVGCW